MNGGYRNQRGWWAVAALCALGLGGLWQFWRPPPPPITKAQYLAWAAAEIDPIVVRLKARSLTAEDISALRAAMESGVQRKQVAALGVLTDLPRLYPERHALRGRLRQTCPHWRVRIFDAPLKARWEEVKQAL